MHKDDIGLLTSEGMRSVDVMALGARECFGMRPDNAPGQWERETKEDRARFKEAFHATAGRRIFAMTSDDRTFYKTSIDVLGAFATAGHPYAHAIAAASAAWPAEIGNKPLHPKYVAGHGYVNLAHVESLSARVLDLLKEYIQNSPGGTPYNFLVGKLIDILLFGQEAP